MTKLDANQVLKMSYSEADQALKTVPGAATSFSVELNADDGDSIEVRSKAVDVADLFTAISAGVDANSVEINTLNYGTVGIVVNGTALAGTLNGLVTVQMSLDNTIWVDTATSGTLDSASKVLNLSVSNFPGKYMRLRFAHVGLSGGTVTAKCILKG